MYQCCTEESVTVGLNYYCLLPEDIQSLYREVKCFKAKAIGPNISKVCQYEPLAYHSRVVTFLLHIFGGYKTFLNKFVLHFKWRL